MPVMYGAESDELDRLARVMDSEADELDQQSRLLTSNLRSIMWIGEIVDRFMAHWNGRLLPRLGVSAAFLREAAVELRHHADEQRTTSAADAGLAPVSSLNSDYSTKIDDDKRIAGTFTPDDPLYDDEPVDVGDGIVGPMIEPDDVSQGGFGDCYLMTGLIVVADQNPGLISDAITDNGDGTYNVRFFNSNGNADYVRVTPEFPEIEVRADDGTWHSSSGTAGEGDGELWPRLLEKAYGQWRSGSDDLVDIYSYLDEGGHASDVYSALSGQPSQQYDDLPAISLDELESMHDEGGYAVSLSSLNDGEKKDATYEIGEHVLYRSHAYWVDEVDAEAGTVTVRNPWGYDRDKFEMTYDEFTRAFDRIDVNTLGKNDTHLP